MFDNVIASIAESVIISCGKNFLQKLLLNLKKQKIKKEVHIKLQSLLLEKQGDKIYYNSFDSFLTNEEFASKLISCCVYPGLSPFKSISDYISYLSEKFVDRNPNYFFEKNQIYQDLYLLSKIEFDILNDYSKDETARIVITQLKDYFNDLYTQLSQQNEKTYALLKELMVNSNSNDTVDFNNQDTIRLYKSSLTSHYICQNHYITRNIYTENDIAQSSVDCLLKDKQIVLLGDPGSGKTYEATNVFKEICTNTAFDKYIPIHMKLMEYGIVYGSINECIKQQLRPYYGKITDEQLTNELSTDKFVIILDGVDEILNKGARVKFFSDINQMLSSTNAYYFITSRINPYYGNIKNIVEYRIQDLSQEQIIKEFQDNGITISLSRQYNELFSNPLFLQIGIKVLKNVGSKFYNKSQLFSAYIEEVCYKRDQSKQLPDVITKNYYNVLMSIGKLAFQTFDKTCLSIAEFDEFFGTENKDYTTNNICDVFRVDIFKVENNISFSHKQFKEYFAAYYLVKKYDIYQNQKLYSSLMKEEHWQEVMVFAAGLITNIDVQNAFLDMMLVANLKTYINCVRHKNDLSASYESLSHEKYSIEYLKILYKSYTLLIETYFPKICAQFAPFKSKQASADENKKVCLVGSVSKDRKYLSFWFDWKDNRENTIQLIPENDMADAYKDLERRAILESRNIVTREVNLELSNLMGDSARQVAIDIIYDSIKNMLDKCNLFESDYILYEKLCSQTKRIKALTDKSLTEIAEWATKQVKKAYVDFDSSHGGILAGVHYNQIDVINLMHIANYLVSRSGTHENLSLPQPDLPLTSGWIWKVYSNERVQERLKVFFLRRQMSFHEMVESNFPIMKNYFSLSRDIPYRYRIHLKFNDTDDFTSDHSITYYRISIKPEESCMPEIIVNEPYPQNYDENIFKLIMNSFHNNGKESNDVSVTSTGFNMTLTSHKHNGNMPLTDVVYEDFKKAFKEIFE